MGSGTWTELAGKLISARSEDECLNFDGCFWWLSGWKQCPTHTVVGMFGLYEQLLPRRLYACQKRIRIRRVRWCEGYVIRLLKVSSMSWLVVLLLHKSSMLPDIMQPWLQDTFLRGSARVRPCRLSATLVLNTKTLSHCTRGTIGNHFGMSLYLGSIKKLEPTE